ncbi:hypothetical protein BFP71_11090 [Roseivirga misakiensis]|uniref:Uncharacterized protein n=1 Tax=Roseivirga misakiensis TaxID=1563681 RepID=A0A1E5SY28_9BACT|nr:hypothetical protein BFP71_11090 [Roseivirga misakiensis]
MIQLSSEYLKLNYLPISSPKLRGRKSLVRAQVGPLQNKTVTKVAVLFYALLARFLHVFILSKYRVNYFEKALSTSNRLTISPTLELVQALNFQKE